MNQKEESETKFCLEEYLSNGVENIVKEALKASLHNPRETMFLVSYAKAAVKARAMRKEAEKRNEHIPPFLIASITSQCNLHCAGCYARANQACHDHAVIDQLSDQEWGDIFTQAVSLGIGFILLAGGEPMMRNDVLKEAAKHKDIVFPIFTNGTLITEEAASLFDHARNLLPVLSIEGSQALTDGRRGTGVYEKLEQAMTMLSKKKLLYGASITVTSKNKQEVMSDEFMTTLSRRDCKVVFFIEFVPVQESVKSLAPDDEDREYMRKRLSMLRQTFTDMVFISFPGDEKSSGGCLAAGRGFFHINSHGGAEPCPFSPYSDTSLREVSLKDALHSPLFTKLRDSGALLEDHAGGCVLFEKKELVETYQKESELVS